MRIKESTQSQANAEKLLDQTSLNGLGSIPLEADRLKANFLRWLSKSHPGDYQRYANRPEIPENEIRDFLKSKGTDMLNVHYLIRFLRGGWTAAFEDR